MDKEKMKRLGNMRRFPIRLKQAKDSEYIKVYMYLEDEVDARIRELEEENEMLDKECTKRQIKTYRLRKMLKDRCTDEEWEALKEGR